MILIIEDTEDSREMLKSWLRLNGLEVQVAATCREGMKIFREESIETVIMDLAMAGKDGLSCGEEMHRLKPEVKIVAYTAYPEAVGDGEMLKRAGFLDYFVKAQDEDRMLEFLKS